ncbi:MAG TPA: DUF3307 domain-containing protein [Mucilaginibacter sp.]
MELIILLRLLLAHLLGDFLLQPAKWVEAKNSRRQKAPEMYYHVLIITALTYLFLWDCRHWYLPLIIMVSHLLIDIWKSYRANSFPYFLADQCLHLFVIITVWTIFYFGSSIVFAWIPECLNSAHFWILITAYYAVTGPLGIAIGSATRKWQKEAGMDKAGLEKAGIWIGRCERVLVLTFIITNQYTALGFLMAAKSILRFKDGEHAQKKTEYILVGTLISFASAAVVGTIVSYLLSRY